MAPGKSTARRGVPRCGAGKSGSAAAGAIEPTTPASLWTVTP